MSSNAGVLEYYTDKEKIRHRQGNFVNYNVTEHWLIHLECASGTTFFVILFPRRKNEPKPEIRYFEREETVEVTHYEGKDIIFMRSYNKSPVTIGNITFSGGGSAVSTKRGHGITGILPVKIENRQSRIEQKR